MNNLVYQQIDELLASSAERTRLTSEDALRVGAATLLKSPAGEINATTIVCDVGPDELDDFESVLAEIADEYGLAAAIQQHVGAYSVRFTRIPTTRPPLEPESTSKSILVRLFAPKITGN